MTRILPLLLLLALLNSPMWAQKTPPDPDQATFAWVFSGQSNMHPGSQFSGFEEVIRDEKYDGDGPGFVLVGQRESGNRIGRWDPTDESGGPNWEPLKKGIQDAQSAGHSVTGFVWYQGEADAGNLDLATRYQANLTDLVARVREASGNPKLPVVIVQLASMRSSSSAQAWGVAIVREAQRRAAEADENIAVVPALDLPIGDAVVHVAGSAQGELGRRQGLAMLDLVYEQAVQRGPRFRRAYFPPGESMDGHAHVILEFTGVTDDLQLAEGWQQGLSVVRGLDLPEDLADWPTDPKDWPDAGTAFENPVQATVLPPNRIVVTFEKPLEAGDRIGWGQSPNAAWGRHRRWGMEFSGISDGSSIPAAAFALAPVADFPDDAESIQADDLSRHQAAAEPLINTAEPFTVSVNFIGGTPDAMLDPDDEAGAPGFEATHWNSAVQGHERYLVDSKNRPTPVGVSGVNTWYPPTTSTPRDTPDAKLLSTSDTERSHTITGLTPGEAYTIVLYRDHPGGPDRQVKMDYTLQAAGKPVSFVWQDAPAQDDADETVYDFRGEYVEATKENTFAGHYIVFRDVQARDNGTIAITARRIKDGGGKVKEGLSGLQVIRRSE